MCLIFSRYKPLFVTAYIIIVFILLETFGYIRSKEMKHEEEGSRNFWSQSLTFLLFQVLTAAFIFLLTWYLFERKLA
jgi:hypothetical protein